MGITKLKIEARNPKFETIPNFQNSKFNEIVKSLIHRHSGESRSPYPSETTGFRRSPE
jgi:hypothetical protein